MLQRGVEAGGSDLARSVVVELHEDKVALEEHGHRVGGVGEGTLGCGCEVVFLAGVEGEVGTERCGEGIPMSWHVVLIIW